MYNRIITLEEAMNEELLLEMANVWARDTGLPYDIWIDSRGKDRNNTHNSPRIKVNVDGQLIPFEISEDPDIPESVKKTGLTDFKHKTQVKEYVKAYYKILLTHFNREISDKQALNLLGKIEDVRDAELRLEDMIDMRPNLRLEYEWDEQECLYKITALSDNGILETSVAISDFELFCELRKLQQKYTINVMIDKSNKFH